MPVLDLPRSARSASTPRRSRATSAAGSGTPPPARASGRSRSPSTTTSCPTQRTRTLAASPRRSPCSRSPSSPTGRSSRCRTPSAEVPEELVDAGARACCASSVAELAPGRGPARAGGRHGRRRPRQPTAARRSATTSSSSAPAGSSRRSRRRSSGMSAGETKEIELRARRRLDRDGRGARSRRSRRRCCRRSTTSSRAPRASSTRSTSCAPTSSSGSREQIEAEVDAAFRAAAVDALVEASNVQASGPLVERAHARAAERPRALARAPRHHARDLPRR